MMLIFDFLDQAFGGGVFLATAFIHMLPELMHDIEGLNIGSRDYPVGFLLVLAGYLVLLCLERVAFSHNHHHDEHHHHHGDQFYQTKHHPHHHPEHHNPAAVGRLSFDGSYIV